MVKSNTSDEDFVRLEVSGVAAGERTLPHRLRKKVQQLYDGDLLRPGVAAVVGFEAARILLEDCPL